MAGPIQGGSPSFHNPVGANGSLTSSELLLRDLNELWMALGGSDSASMPQSYQQWRMISSSIAKFVSDFSSNGAALKTENPTLYNDASQLNTTLTAANPKVEPFTSISQVCNNMNSSTVEDQQYVDALRGIWSDTLAPMSNQINEGYDKDYGGSGLLPWTPPATFKADFESFLQKMENLHSDISIMQGYVAGQPIPSQVQTDILDFANALNKVMSDLSSDYTSVDGPTYALYNYFTNITYDFPNTASGDPAQSISEICINIASNGGDSTDAQNLAQALFEVPEGETPWCSMEDLHNFVMLYYQTEPVFQPKSEVQ